MRTGGGMALAIVAFLAFSACTVEPATSGLGTTGSGTAGSAGTTSSGAAGTSSGAAGSTTSSGGSSGAGGSATGGSAGDGSDGSAGGAATDGAIADMSSEGGGAACFAEDTNGDAGTQPCSSLPYYTQLCADDGGGHPPLGAVICKGLDQAIKIAAAQELFDCLKAIPGADGGADACSAAHEAAAGDCSKKIFNRSTCSVPDGNVDGGAYGCAQIVASCPPDGGTAGITLGQCQAWLIPFNVAARQGIIECYLNPATPAGTSCADKFENECVFAP